MVFEKMENNNSSGESESESDFKAEVSILFYPHKVASSSGTPKKCDQSSVVELLLFFTVPVPVPTFEKLQFWFWLRFRFLTSYGSGSVSRP